MHSPLLQAFKHNGENVPWRLLLWTKWYLKNIVVSRMYAESWAAGSIISCAFKLCLAKTAISHHPECHYSTTETVLYLHYIILAILWGLEPLGYLSLVFCSAKQLMILGSCVEAGALCLLYSLTSFPALYHDSHISTKKRLIWTVRAFNGILNL